MENIPFSLPLNIVYVIFSRLLVLSLASTFIIQVPLETENKNWFSVFLCYFIKA